MYVNELITLQENASTYGEPGKSLSGHITMRSPGRIMCYVQNLQKQSPGNTYGLYLFSKARNKGVRIGELSNERETKWLVNEQDICGSGLKLDELDGVAVVAERMSRGTEMVLSGFREGRFMVIPLIEEIFNSLGLGGQTPRPRPGGPGQEPPRPRPGGPGPVVPPPPRPGGPGQVLPPPRPGGPGPVVPPPPRPGGPGPVVPSPPRPGGPGPVVPPPPRPGGPGPVVPPPPRPGGPGPVGPGPVVPPPPRPGGPGQVPPPPRPGGPGPVVPPPPRPGGPGPVVPPPPRPGGPGQVPPPPRPGGPGPVVPPPPRPGGPRQNGQVQQPVEVMAEEVNLGNSLGPLNTGTEGTGQISPSPRPGEQTQQPVGVMTEEVNLGNSLDPINMITEETGQSNATNSQNNIGKAPEPIILPNNQDNIGQGPEFLNTVNSENNTPSEVLLEGEPSGNFENVNKEKVLDQPMKKLLATDTLESGNADSTSVGEDLSEPENNPAILNSEGSGIPGASVVREQGGNEEALMHIISKLKEDEVVKAKTKSIEEQIEKMRQLPQSHKLFEKSAVERAAERHYIHQQDALYDEEEDEEEDRDSSPRKAHQYLAEEAEEAEEAEVQEEVTSGVEAPRMSEREAVDYMNEIEKKIKEIEKKRHQEIIRRNSGE